MFQMTVEESMRLHDNLITVSGSCINKHNFLAGELHDESGVVYDAHIPFVKTLVHDENSVILGIYGSMDISSMIGKTLKSQ